MDVSFVQVALIFVVTFIAAIDQFDFLESLYQPSSPALSLAQSSATCRPVLSSVVPTS